MKTKYYKQKGGLQSFNNRIEEQHNAVDYLLSTYPTYFARKKSHKTHVEFPEIRILKQS